MKRTIAKFEGAGSGAHATTAIVRYDSELAEYVVSLNRAGVEQTSANYFTDDRADALATAKAML